jgi:guanylate cyclase soluble subunit beta
LDKFDLAAWEGIVEAAGMPKDVSWVLSEYYPDSVTVSLVVAASEKLGVDAGTVLGIYGGYFISYLKKNSLDKKLHIMGDNLKDFLHNLDYLHGHLQDTFGNVRYRAR